MGWLVRKSRQSLRPSALKALRHRPRRCGGMPKGVSHTTRLIGRRRLARPNDAFPISGPTRSVAFPEIAPLRRKARLPADGTAPRPGRYRCKEICIPIRAHARLSPHLERPHPAFARLDSGRAFLRHQDRPRRSPSSRSTSRPANASTTRRSVTGVGPVDKDEILKGFEYTKGNYVLLTDEDLESVKLETRKTFDLAQFVGACEIEPIYFDKPYFVVPQDELAEDAYRVVRDALKKTEKIGLGQLTMRGKEYLAALKPCGKRHDHGNAALRGGSAEGRSLL